jgi:hypothetical protein
MSPAGHPQGWWGERLTGTQHYCAIHPAHRADARPRGPAIPPVPHPRRAAPPNRRRRCSTTLKRFAPCHERPHARHPFGRARGSRLSQDAPTQSPEQRAAARHGPAARSGVGRISGAADLSATGFDPDVTRAPGFNTAVLPGNVVRIRGRAAGHCFALARELLALLADDRPAFTCRAIVAHDNDPRTYGRHLTVVRGALVISAGLTVPRVYEAYP